MKAIPVLRVFVSAMVLLAARCTWPQATSSGAQGMQHGSSGTTPLANLLEEARLKNPQILAAEHGYKAAATVPKSAGALPETQVTIQHLSVGSPRPFAGYTNSDFAYIGLGVSQELPYPGKRKLRAEVAQREADSKQAQWESTSRGVVERLKETYFRLAYVQQAIRLLEHHDQVLGEMQQIAEARYRVGQGNQQEVLKAQLQHTKILQEIAMSRRDEGQLEAQIKQLLSRSQDSADILAERLTETVLPYSAVKILQLAQEQNPDIHSQQAMLRQAESQVELARREFLPDFNLQYMYQNTDRKFRDYYMLTFGVTLPNRKRRQAELAEAQEKQARAYEELQAENQRARAEVQQQWVAAQTSAEQLRIYREGLVPQAAATFASAMAAYQANRQDSQTLLSSFLDALDLELEYERELMNHESALARIEALTGGTLP